MIVISIDDFRRCAELSGRIGKWQAWRDYYFPKYEDVFAPMLKYLYRCDVGDLRYAVESFDFDHDFHRPEERHEEIAHSLAAPR